jgi:hypothetical protein
VQLKVRDTASLDKMLGFLYWFIFEQEWVLGANPV